jgi:hypothetical protein
VSEAQQNGRRRLTDIGTLILRGLAVAVLSAAILVHSLTIGSQMFVPSCAVGRSAINVPVAPLEQVAAKVLPSVVTLQTDQGPRGLTMTTTQPTPTMDAGIPGKTHSHSRAVGPPAMTTVSDRVIATESAPAAEPTDGYHVVVEALKLNGVETIYRCGRYPGH